MHIGYHVSRVVITLFWHIFPIASDCHKLPAHDCIWMHILMLMPMMTTRSHVLQWLHAQIMANVVLSLCIDLKVLQCSNTIAHQKCMHDDMQKLLLKLHMGHWYVSLPFTTGYNLIITFIRKCVFHFKMFPHHAHNVHWIWSMTVIMWLMWARIVGPIMFMLWTLILKWLHATPLMELFDACHVGRGHAGGGGEQGQCWPGS